MATANSVMRLPYQLKDGSHILSDMSVRTGKPVDACELRITVGGWVSQTLLHSANPVDIIDRDVERYVLDKGFKMTDLGAVKLIESLKKSQTLVAQYVPAGPSWTLVPRVKPLRYDVDGLCAAVWAVAIAGESPSFGQNYNTGGSSSWSRNGMLPVPLWPETEPQIAFIESIKDAPALGSLNDGARRRLVDPFGWFEGLLREHGFAESDMHFAGYIDGNDRTVIPGLVEVRGPMDMNGRCPRFQYPAYDARFGLVIPFSCGHAGAIGDAHSNSLSWLVNGKNWTFGEKLKDLVAASVYKPNPAVRIEKLGRWGPGAGGGGDSAGWDKVIGQKHIAAYVPLPVSTIETLRATTGSIFDGALPLEVDHSEDPVRKSVINAVMTSTKWRIARPLTLLDFKIPSPVIKVVRDNPGEMRVIELRAPVMGMTMPFEALRDAARTEIKRNGSNVDKAGLEKFIRDSEQYVDALVYSSFYAQDFTPVTMADIENLEIVRVGVKADKKVLDELVNDKQTLRQLARRVDNDRKKGVKYSGFSNVVDEVASTEDLVSDYVGQRLRFGTGWVLAAVKDPTGTYTAITGQFGDELITTLSPLEASLLKAHGAGGNVPPEAWASLGITDASDEDLRSIGKLVEKGNRGALTWAKPIPRKWDVLTPREFCSGDGYPVMNYVDRDSYARAMMLFKSLTVMYPTW